MSAARAAFWILVTASCHPEPGATGASASPPVAPLASARASASASSPSAGSPSPFEDQFDYGEYDAGPGDASRLSSRPGYDSYRNERFGFSLDVPRALDATPDPTNGDGRQWRLGRLVAMTASGMHGVPEGDEPFACTPSKAVTGCRATKTSLWRTGKSGGYVHWERTVVAHGVRYSLRLQYVESLETAMGPVVTRVNASWTFR